MGVPGGVGRWAGAEIRPPGRRVEKSEILRSLIRLAFTSPPTTEAFGRALDLRTRP